MFGELRDKLGKKKIVIISIVLCILLSIGFCVPTLVLYGNFQNPKTSESDSSAKLATLKKKRPKLKKTQKIKEKTLFRPTKPSKTKSTTIGDSKALSTSTRISLNSTSTLPLSNVTTESSTTGGCPKCPVPKCPKTWDF